MNQPMPPMPPPPPILVSTMNDVPGYRVVRVIGEVFGSTVRSRNAFSDIGASFKGMFGGEQAGYTQLLNDSRFEALGRLKQNAAGMGANAVLAMRFESGDIMPGSTEIAAYGTAVFIVPLDQQGPGGPGPGGPGPR
ncbi:YbjQ family protein [Allokutzneria multivorans]